jgi:hypothetical protein
LGRDAVATLQSAAVRPIAGLRIPEIGRIASRRQQRRKKMLWCMLLEAIALSLVVASIRLGASTSQAKETLTLPFQFAVFVAACAAVIIPVLFYGLPGRDQKMRRYR